jgi:hypothetical protein
MRILVGVSEGEEHDMTLEVAAQLAQIERAKVTVVYVHAGKATTDAEALVARARDRLAPTPVEVQRVQGSSLAAALHELAAAEQADLIVRNYVSSASQRTAAVDPEAVDQWFILKGLPQFTRGHVRESIRYALPLLLVMAAAVLTSIPWLRFDSSNVVTDALPLLLLGIWLVPLVRWTLGDIGRPRRGAVAIWLLLLLPIAWRLAESLLPSPLHVTWVDFTFTLIVLAAAARLVTSDPRLARPRTSRAGLVLTVLLPLMIVVAALEGTEVWPLTEANEPGASVRGLVSDWRSDVPDALPMIPVALIVLGLALGATWGPRQQMTSTARSHPLAAFVTATPWLAVTWAVQVALLPYIDEVPTTAEVVGPLVLAAAFLTWAWLRRAAQSRPELRPHPAGLLVLLAATVLAHVAILGSLELPVQEPLLLDSLIALLAIFVVVAGIDRLLMSSIAEAVRAPGSIGLALVRGLPVLLIFLGFFGVVEEVWRIAANEPVTTYAKLAGALVLVAVGYLILDAHMEVKRSAKFESWHEVNQLLTRDKGVPPGIALGLPSTDFAPALRLTWREHVNAMGVVLAHYAIVLSLVAVAAYGIFYGLGQLVVIPDLFYDTDQLAAARSAWRKGAWWEQPWSEVAMLLAGFSVLYLAVHITGVEQRTDFLSKPHHNVRRALATLAAARQHWPDRHPL